MSNPFPTPTDLNQWSFFVLGGVASPGTIPRGGLRGFQRETGWDEKRGKGSKGATLTLTSAPPVKGTIALQLIGPGGILANGNMSEDFASWDKFVSAVLSDPVTQGNQQGLPIYYPGFAAIGLTTVVVKAYHGPEHQGRNIYICTIELLEWVPPPPVSVVSTVQSAKPDAVDTGPGTPPQPVNPRVAAKLAELDAAEKATTP